MADDTHLAADQDSTVEGEKLSSTFSCSAEERHAALIKTNAETFRLTNDGRFSTRVSLAFENQSQVSDSQEPRNK